MPKLSVVVPVYNIKEFLPYCINSVLSQFNGNTELLLIDDGSTDGSEKICDEYSLKNENIRVIHKKNAGVSSARNTGIEEAGGEFIWFLDADDFLLDGAIEEAFSHFDETSDFYCYKNFSVSEDGKSFFESSFKYPYVGEADEEQICLLLKKACSSCIFPYVWRNVYRKSFLINNNIRFFKGLNYGEDSIFGEEAFLKAKKVIFFDKEVIAYRRREGSLSKNNSIDEKKIREIETYCSLRDEKYENLCKHKYKEFYEDAGKYALTNIYMNAFLLKIYMGNERHKFSVMKKVTKLPVIRQAFERFDINSIKSKSLDWLMFWAAKHNIYILVHIICKYIIFKK